MGKNNGEAFNEFNFIETLGIESNVSKINGRNGFESDLALSFSIFSLKTLNVAVVETKELHDSLSCLALNYL